MLAGVVVFVALGASAPAHASTPMPWCGTDSAATDRLPDATPGFAIHVAYVHPPGSPDRFAEWAPRIVGDVAAIDAWWRREDPTRAPRFDLFPFPCAGFGALDITNVALPQGIGGIGSAFSAIRLLLFSAIGFDEPEKVYLTYFDGPTGQVGNERVCGQGASPGARGLPGVAVVYLDSCSGATGDVLRPVVAVHEAIHVLGAVDDRAPHGCESGHVCDVDADLMTASLRGEDLDSHVLDAGRDDYYGHGGTWSDVRNSLFLERLDSPDRTPPAAPTRLLAGGTPAGEVRLSWDASTDDVGPVTYRLYGDDTFVRSVSQTAVSFSVPPGETALYSVRAQDGVGHLSQPASVRFKAGVGVVDEAGTLLRDTVAPPAVRQVTVRRRDKVVGLSWPAVKDPGGLRGYRVRIGTRTLTVKRPAVTIARSRVKAPVTVAAVDRAGNVGPATSVPVRRLR
jgi:hypothetical protein